MERLIEGDYPMDIMAFVQWVLRESYLETTHSLRDFANRVRFFNEQKEAVRNELDRVRGILSDKPNAEAGDQVGPFESGKFNETYLGSQIEKSKASTNAPAAVEETEFKVLALPHLRDINVTPTLSSHEQLGRLQRISSYLALQVLVMRKKHRPHNLCMSIKIPWSTASCSGLMA